MTLASYMATHKLNNRHVAEALGVNPETVRMWRNGATPIPARRAVEIEARTGIPLYELRPDLWKPPKGRRSTAPESPVTQPWERLL